MKPIKLVLIALIMLTASIAYSQKVNRGDVCDLIPNLTTQQKSEISELSTQHQKTMDALRIQFRSETDISIATSTKTKMNEEQNAHYLAISKLLTTEQKTWFDQSCIRNSGQGYGRGQGFGRGQSYARGQGNGRGQSYARGQGNGRGRGNNGRGQGYGRQINL